MQRRCCPAAIPYRTLVEETLATRAVARTGADVARATSDDELLLMTHADRRAPTASSSACCSSRATSRYLSRMQSTLAYSRKLVALGRLTAGIAHEVKNPLNAMMIHLELLRTKIRERGAWRRSRRPWPRRAAAGAGQAAADAGAAAGRPRRARARRSHRERDPPARRGGAGLPEVHAARGPAAAAGARVGAVRRRCCRSSSPRRRRTTCR